MLVGQNRGHSDELLHSRHTAELSREDRNLATALVMGTLRWQISLDARIMSLLARPDQDLPDPVKLALRLGAFQLLHMDRIPAHAAINESVELCRAAGHPHAAGMVNAILRKLSSASLPGKPLFESTAAFAERLGHPLWLVERWVKAFGRQIALAICEYDQREPHSGGHFPAQAAINEQEFDTASTPQMDDGSRLVAELAAAALPSNISTPRVWDCCAAPGGKTLILAERLPQAQILATDVSPRRLAEAAARFRRHDYAANINTEVADASQAEMPGPAFDLILCDVPCTGTGTLARNPEIRHRLRPEELPRQARRQSSILRNALRHLAPGGRLVYSTCSLEAEENEQIVAAVAGEMDLHVVSGEELLDTLQQSSSLLSALGSSDVPSAFRNEALRTLPGVHPCDGFFAAVLVRN